jgi:ribosomal protein L7/L12
MAERSPDKTAWEHVLGEPVASPPGERPMKAQLDARFDGSFKQFCEWIQETFKNPDDLRVRVVVGNFDLREEVVVEHTTFSNEAQKLHALPGVAVALSLPQAEALLKAIRKVQRSTRGDSRIQAIKMLREKTHIGLKEAKDFIESLPPPPPGKDDEDEIPF